MDLKNRVALVTGGSRGIGRATVLLLTEMGVHVCINYQREREVAEALVREVEAKGVRALALQANVARMKESEFLIQATLESFGQLDILICNAGVWKGGAVEEISEEMWDEVLDINLRGTWTVCRAAVPRMKERREGKIVIVTSTAGQRGEAFVSNYAASKGGQISFTKSLAAELGPHNINVNAVAPGWVLTEMTEQVLAQEDERRKVTETIPLGRIATPEEVAAPIVFLCTDWARHITGEILNVNGGSVLCG